MKLDTLLVNGKFYTMEEEGHFVDAVGIKDGIIEFVGTSEESRLLKSNETIDLNGNTAVPGLADSHMHMYAYCQNQTSVNLESAGSIGQMVELLKKHADIMPEGTWIKGVNFDQSKFSENRFPTRYDLDKISTKHPIVAKRCCLHAIVANSVALEIAGIRKGYVGGSGGIVEFDDDGEPNGILREQCTKVFDEIIPDPLSDENIKKQFMLEVFKDMTSKGITSIHTYAAKIWRYQEDINLYMDFEKEGLLPVRVTVCFDELFKTEILTREQKENPYRMVQYGSSKFFTDGSLGSRSAYLKEPYSDQIKNKGFVTCTQGELNLKIVEAYKMGLQPSIHAIGDAALEMTLTAIENALVNFKDEEISSIKGTRLPFRIIHAQMINEELIDRMKKLPVVIDVQPIFLCTDMHWIEERIGKERLKGAYSWKTMLDEGLMLAGGSDCPVESYDPMLGIYAAVSRKDLSGYPDEGFMPDEKLSVYEAFSLFTKNVHYSTGQQDKLGTLTKGKFADIAVLDRNPFECREDELKCIKVQRTFVAGRQVFVL